jgi:gamma-tubulin complex component 3
MIIIDTMSGFFQSATRGAAGDDYSAGFRHTEPAAWDKRSSASADDNNDLIQRLAALIQNEGNRHPTMQQQNDVERLRIMLASLTSSNSNNSSPQKITSPSRNNNNDFNSKSVMKQQPPPSSLSLAERQQTWYTHERAILRELIVLTMRHSNGDLLRFIPAEDERQEGGEFIWDATCQNWEGNRFNTDAVVEGARLIPRCQVIPEFTPGDNDDDDGKHEDEQHIMENLEFRANLPTTLLGSGARDAISLCGECGWLYGRVATYVETVLEDDVDGIQCSTARALAARLDYELGEYHRQLSMLESELPPLIISESTTTTSSSSSQQDQHQHHVAQARYLTLRELVARLPPIRDHLRTLAILADGVGARNLRGGKLLAAILRHSLDGDTSSSHLVRSIAADCSVPWYKMLNKWITQGVLDDFHSEFFVREMQLDHKSSSGFFTWHERYVLVDGQVPLCCRGGLMEIITSELAQEVLLVGKGINFIRYCLQDKDWEVVEQNDGRLPNKVSGCEGYSFSTLNDEVGCGDEFKCVSTLHDVVSQSSARIHSHILDSLKNQHHLMSHLHALKQFLFLFQGDFVSSFVESLDVEFRGRTSTAGIYNHTLASLLEGSLRTTNARYLPNYVLRNLGVRLMIDEKDSDRYWMGQPSKTKSDEMTPWVDNEASIQDPWDYICIDYQINSPLDAIVHDSAIRTYQHVFLFLFRLKRVEWMLNNSWRQSTALNHAILVETKAGGADAPAISEAAEHSSYLLRRISTTRQTMLHFISNLQNYLMFEVLEGGWEGLERSIKKAKSLDDVILAHNSYLGEIVEKSLLGDKGDGESPTLETLLQKLLSIALKFGKFQDHIFTNSLAGLDKAARIRKQVEERAEKGEWGRTTLDTEEGRVFRYLADAKLFEFVERTANDFERVFSNLLKMMSKQVDQVDWTSSIDEDQEETITEMKTHDALPFLLFRLDFSGYYARQAREKRKQVKIQHQND